MLSNKGQSFGWEHVIGLLLILFVLGVLLGYIPIFGKSSANSISCDSKKGQCRATCEGGEIPWTFDPTQKCEKDKMVCCMPPLGTTSGTTAASECKGKKTGEKCSTVAQEFFVCNENSQCITKCEYCAAHPADTVNCKVSVTNFAFNSNYACGCSQTECDEKKKSNPPTCISVSSTGFCYPGAFCCEK